MTAKDIVRRTVYDFEEVNLCNSTPRGVTARPRLPCNKAILICEDLFHFDESWEVCEAE